MFKERGRASSSGMTPMRGRPARSMASSMVACMLRSIFLRTRFTVRCSRPVGKRCSSITVCWASRREEASAVATTTQRSAPQVAS